MIADIKAAVSRLGRSVGLEIRASGPAARADLRLAHFLNREGIDNVIDVGANQGQFAQQLIAAGYCGSIRSIEALPDAHATLCSNAKLVTAADWQALPRMALSDSNGETEFHMNVGDATSSLLAASTQAEERIPALRTASIIRVGTRTLDSLIADCGIENGRSFLKIDVQGGEAKVLAGAGQALDKIVGLVVELSFTEIYAGQPFALDILNMLVARGFEVEDISTAFRDPASFRLHQIDAVLFHKDRRAPA